MAPSRCLPGDRHRLRPDRAGHGRRLLAREPGRRGAAGRDRRRRASGVASGCTSRSGSCSGCRSCSPSMPSAAGSSRRASWRTGSTSSSASSRRSSARSSSARTCSPPCRRCRRRGSRPGSGSINTMVFTHLPSNVLLILVPLMPTLPLAVAGPVAAVQPQPDGRADPAVVRDGRRGTGRTIRGRRRDRGRANDGRRDLAVVLERDDGQRRLCGPAVLSRGRPEDPVRPADVPRLPERPAARGAWRGPSRSLGRLASA